ncbi:MAG: LysM peptidoglycan-binding domain-containing protein [Flavobacteriales bacterium]|nr:LysM peptidoglycan-binding domain-containing protein [Flavobacteriales bacterium]
MISPRSILLSLAILLFFNSFNAFSAMPAERDTSSVAQPDTTGPVILPDDPTLAAMDALWVEERFRWQAFESDTAILNTLGFRWDSIPKYSSDELAAKLQKLNNHTPFDLQHNRTVEAFINLYTEQRRDVTSRVLGLAALYYPMFEEKLDQYNIPLELKHLAVVESALNPSARSRVGATGLWQFMYATGKMYGLQVDTYTDERRDPLKSTIAACKYMLFLYGMYDDWNLVLAAYNSGPGNVNKAIRRSGGKRDYWDIRPYLPRETRGYVPAFIAVNYVMNYASDHNIYPSMPSYLFAEVDTVHICRETSFNQIAKVTGVTVESLEVLNPAMKRNIIPETEICTHVYLPVQAVGEFLANVDSLYKMPDEEPQLVDGKIYEDVVETHVVRSGEVLGVIAQRYGVSTSSLREWNNVRGNRIYPGQKLEIKKTITRKPGETTPPKDAPKQVAAAVQKQATSGSDRTHTVQSGDTLWDIARMYPGISANDIIRVNRGVSSHSLRPGQKLKIPPTS